MRCTFRSVSSNLECWNVPGFLPAFASLFVRIWGESTQIASSGGDEVFRGVVGENWLAKHPIRMPSDPKLSKMTVLLRCSHGNHFVAQ
jgi:hypothetical protein